MTDPRALSSAECLARLRTATVGRVAVCTPDGPHIVPVNYALDAASVVFRTSPYSLVGTHGWDRQLAFEVDHIDAERKEAWSVLAKGRGVLVEEEAELERIGRACDPTPWADGERMLYIRLRWAELEGRELGTPRSVLS